MLSEIQTMIKSIHQPINRFQKPIMRLGNNKSMHKSPVNFSIFAATENNQIKH
jgi:hypothetical protein